MTLLDVRRATPICYRREGSKEGTILVQIRAQRRRAAIGLAVIAARILGSFLLATSTWGADSAVNAPADDLPYPPDVVLVMKDKRFHIVKGADSSAARSIPSFSLPQGMDVVILILNEDTVAHEFVSPLLQKVDLYLSGQASMVYTHTAAGVRVDPQEAVLLRFEVPEAGFDQFHFWCNIHGKLFDDPMRGEIFILKPSQP